MILQIADAPVLTGDKNVDLLNYMMWIGGIMVIALCGALIKVWSKWNKDKDDQTSALKIERDTHAAELKAERDYIKEEGKEQAKILNGLSQVLSDLSKGIEKDLPRDIKDVKDTVITRINEIKDYQSRNNSGT